MSKKGPDLQLVWREACTEFIKTTGINLDVPSPTAQQIVAKLDELKEAKDAKSKTAVSRAKRVVGNTMRAVKTIGGLFVSGASLTGFGGPASVTMNCISFFIDAGFAYNKIAENIEDLFSRIEPIMERAQVYVENQDVIGDEMKTIVSRLLIAVVKTCQHCISILRPVHSKRAKAKLFFEVALFSSDGGVQGQLNVLKSIQEQEMYMSNAVTVVTVKNVAQDVGAINAILKKDKEDMAEGNVLAEVKQKLGVDDTLVKAVESQYRSRRDKLKTGTCAWLKEDAQYLSWSNPNKESSPVILLRGKEGCGKSYVMASVIRDLLGRYPQCQGDSTRISVAYFFFSRGGQGSQKESRSAKIVPSVKDTLRTLASQALENDIFYRKDLHKTVQNNPDFGDLKQFLLRLFLDHLAKGAVFFLLLDDTQELDEEGRAELSSLLDVLVSADTDLRSLRIMLTAKDTLSQSLVSRAPSLLAAIRLEEKNQADMRSYVEAKADTFAVFKKSTEEIQDLKNWVIAELPVVVAGNFLLAERKLQEISSSDNAEDVRRIIGTLRKEGANLFDTIEQDIRLCNRTLSTKEVRNLNALLLWVIYAEGGIQIGELEAMLFIQEQHTSFQPLYKEIKEKYDAFFNVEENGDEERSLVSLKYTALEEYFQKAAADRDSSTTTQVQALSKGEIHLVRHFIEKLCDDGIYKRLGLAAFFDERLAKSEVSVAVECENAHARIVLVCLKQMTGKMGDKAQALEPYARYRIAAHLEKIDLDTVDPQLKAEIGPLLYQLFTDEEIVAGCNENAWTCWAYDDTLIAGFVRLLRSSAVVKKISQSEGPEKKWLDAVLGSKSPEVEILRKTVQVKSEEWASSENFHEVSNPLLWLYGYYNKIESKVPAERLDNPLAPNSITLRDILHIYEAIITPALSESSKTTASRNLGITMLHCEQISSSIKQLTEYVEANTDDLLARDALATAYTKENKKGGTAPDWEKAFMLKDMVIEQVKSGKRLSKNEEPQKSWKALTLIKAQWLRQLYRHEEALVLLQNLLQETPEDNNAKLEVVQTLCESQRYGEVVELLQVMQSDIDKTTGKSALSKLFCSQVSQGVFHMLLFKAFQQTNQMTAVQSHYREAIKDAAGGTDRSERYIIHNELNFYFGFLLYRVGSGTPERDEAIKIWEGVVDRCKNDATQVWRQMICTWRLIKAYLAEAVEAGKASETADTMLKKVNIFLANAEEEQRNMAFAQMSIRALLARYYQATGDLDRTREQLKPDMELAIMLLSDEDPDNDWQGYAKLGNTLMYSGDDENAIAAFTLIQPTVGIGHLLQQQEGKADAEENAPEYGEANSSVQPRGPLRCGCDGGCGTNWTYADDIYFCKDCIDIQLTADCLEKLRQGEFDPYVCDPAHEFMHVPSWTVESAQRAQRGKVLVGETEKDIQAWIKELTQAWQIDLAKKDPSAAV